MKNFCLLPNKVAELKKAFKDKDVTVDALMNMTSAQRTELFSKYAGESAKDINLAFEKKLVLKNQVRGVTNLLSKLIESGKYSKEEVARMAIAKEKYQNAKMERILNPEENEAFLSDLAEDIFDKPITEAEAK